MSYTEYLCENYSSDAEVADLVNNREIWMMPVINPDGYVHNEASHPNGGGMWRKNRRSINNEVVGVDLNRNWPLMWANDDLGSSPNPSSQTYRGESAGSEPETQAIINFINNHEFKLIINYHSYSEEPETRWYKARTRDTQGQFSAWSSLVSTVLDTSGDSTSVISEQLGEQPFEFSVSEAYPNPFNPETSLRVTLPSSTQLNVTVFDILGREVYSKVYYNQQAGSIAVTLNGTSWASGFYFARVQMNGEQAHYSVLRKIVLLK